jgi:surface glycoprotein (TIGR04207 family)
MTGDASRSQKALSVFLLILMVGSVMAIGGVAFTGSAAAATLEVGTNSGYTSIQSAVDNASSGDTISIATGDYDEQVVIDKELTINAEDGATLSYSSSPGSSYAANSYMIVNNSSSVTINGLEFTGPFEASNTAGLFVTGGASVDANGITMNQMFDATSGGVPSGTQAHGAIALGHERYTESSEFGSIEIDNSEIDEFGKFAIQISGEQSSATITETQINGSGDISDSSPLAQDSILVDQGDLMMSSSTFEDIRSADSSGTGVTVYGPSNSVEIRNNTFDDVNKPISLQSFRNFDDTSGVIEGVIVHNNTIQDQFQAVDIFSERA